jgi:hypothetical protein
MSPDRAEFALPFSLRRGIYRAPGYNPLKFMGGIESLEVG